MNASMRAWMPSSMRSTLVMVVGLVSGLVAASAATASATAAAAGADAEGVTLGPPGPVRYRPPVTAPVTDPFRAPLSWYGPGNRGIEYDTSTVRSVASIGDGTVTFAGPVAARLVVVVTHPDGLRSSYTGLRTIDVARGERVVLGGRLGDAGPRLHLGLRSARTYLDPARYFSPLRRHAVLVGPHERSMPRRGP